MFFISLGTVTSSYYYYYCKNYR